MNEENKSKIFIGTLVAIITLLVAVVGATYAFFSLNVSGDTTSTNVDIETGTADIVSIQQGAENIHINLEVSDMAENNPNKAYYATDTEDNYKLTEREGTLTFATITGTNKEASDCTAKVTITMDTSNDSMGKALQKGDAILYITSGKTEETIGLYDLLGEEESSSVTKEIEVELSVSESAEASITGYLKVNNTGSDQSYLAGKTLNITITVNNLVCGGARGNAVAFIAETSTSGTLDTQEMLQARNAELTAEGVASDDLDTLRRFAGEYTEVTDNFICFGTNDTNTCKNNLDQYMYRIIGIDEINNQIKVIKATPILKEAKFTFRWHKEDYSNIKWDQSDIYKYLNSSNAEESYFVGNPYYSYMQDSSWADLIITNPTWYYGDNIIQSSYTAKTSYKHERDTKLENGSPIGLMYVSDYLYVGSENEINWLYIRNGLNRNLNTGTAPLGTIIEPNQQNLGFEWTMTRKGILSGTYDAYIISEVGKISLINMDNKNPLIRSAFYLDGSKITLDGEGTIGTPYYIKNA